MPGARVRWIRPLAVVTCVSIGLATLTGEGLSIATVQLGDRPDDAALGVLALFLVGYAVCFVAAATTFIIWLYQARSNLNAFVGVYPRWAKGWTIGAWFIPIASLVLVPRVVVDVAENSIDPAQPERGHGLVGTVWAWWIAFVLAGCAARVTNRSVDADPSVGVLVAGAVLFTVAAVLAMVVVLRITAHQQRQADRAAPPALVPGMIIG